jgi:cysteine desulfurase/selenocysteine lyase
VIVTDLDHESNIGPWRELAADGVRVLEWKYSASTGALDVSDLDALLSSRTRLVCFTHCSNVVGSIHDTAAIVRRVHEAGALACVDGVAFAPHRLVDVKALDADFLAFSGHKLYGPTGIGVLWGREPILEAMPPWQGGGDMIRSVTMEKATWNELPHKFEAGTPAIAEAIGLGAAVSFIGEIGWESIRAREQDLRRYVGPRLPQIRGLRLLGAAAERAPVFAFTLPGAHPSDIGALLDTEGVAIRTGTHCTEPLHARFGLTASARASFSFYNTRTEADLLMQGLEKVLRLTR